MSNIFLTSDWHLGHDREFIWKIRGFASVEDMNEAIIERHNAQVKEDDDVYVLGDVCLGAIDNINHLLRLNGKLHFVRGNHDTDLRWKVYETLPNVVEMDNVILLKYKDYHIYMSHYPTLTGNLERESLKQMTINFYGHTHQKTNFYEDRPYMYHVGVDSHNCFPVPIDIILTEMKMKVNECIAFL